MLTRNSIQPNPQTCLTARDGKQSLHSLHTPTQNLIIAALPAKHYERLLPDLTSVPLPLGWHVYGPSVCRRYLYFPTEGIVCRSYVMEDGKSAGFALTGNEGVVGIASFLGGDSTLSQATVLSAGHAYRLHTDLLKNDTKLVGSLSQLLLRYTLALVAQIGQISACNRHHTLEQQLCNWILSCLDRAPSNEIRMTQEVIANMLGVRREGISEAAGNLQKAGLIHYRRGHIIVLARPGLEARACECYGVVKQEYDRLLPPVTTIAWARGAAASHGLCRH